LPPQAAGASCASSHPKRTHRQASPTRIAPKNQPRTKARHPLFFIIPFAVYIHQETNIFSSPRPIPHGKP
jgi:hypothetical protein